MERFEAIEEKIKEVENEFLGSEDNSVTECGEAPDLGLDKPDLQPILEESNSPRRKVNNRRASFEK